MFKQHVLAPVLSSIANYSQRNAFCINSEFYTYEQFGERISAIRSELVRNSYKNKKVGLVIEDDIDSYAAIFALWLEGACYVPLHPHWPIDRCFDIINQVGIDLIIDPTTSSSRFSDTGFKNIILTKKQSFSGLYLEPISGVSDRETAYIIFTSGSTGKPKGVPIMRLNVGTFISSLFKFVTNVTCEDRCLQCFDLSFDNSVLAYLVPLTKGACMYTVPHNVVKYTYIALLLEEEELTFSYMVPSTISLMKPFFGELQLPKLKYSLFAGEALYADVTKLWYECIPNAELYCCYGPTETTVIMSYHRCYPHILNKSYNGVISMGKCMEGTDVLILDDENNIKLVGEVGEICISGNQVFDGYWNNEELNKKVFVEIDGKRYYRSGDLGYIDEEGELMSAGRKDFQVKIQGFRIELGEIEHHAREFMGGCNTACITTGEDQSHIELVLFLECDNVDNNKLTAYLHSKMPPYMVPGKIECRPHFPFNSNGKVDKKQIKIDYLNND